MKVTAAFMNDEDNVEAVKAVKSGEMSGKGRARRKERERKWTCWAKNPERCEPVRVASQPMRVANLCELLTLASYSPLRVTHPCFPPPVDRTKERLKQLTETGSDEKMQELTQVSDCESLVASSFVHSLHAPFVHSVYGCSHLCIALQSEYTSELQRLHKEISRAWIAGERVLSIKLVIKCTKLLADATTAPQFYPTVFVIVTEILDTFGKLVYDRIKAKAEEDPTNPNKRKRLPANFTADDVNVNACETCRNWFYKISSVRELLPRLYLEMCLLPCYAFLSKTEYPAVLKRLAR